MSVPHLIVEAHHIGEHEIHTRHYIEADDRQKVKYWFHRFYKQFGHKPDWATNKHTIDTGGREVVELEQIKRIGDSTKAHVLDEELPRFPKS
jgi:hypothetical protein